MSAQPFGGRSAADQRGVVVHYNAARGFGFIRPDDGLGQQASGTHASVPHAACPDVRVPDVFVHIRDVTNAATLYPGQRVRYRLMSSARGPTAVQVRAGSLLTLPHLRYTLAGLVPALLLFLVGSLWFRPGALPGWLALWAIASSAATFGVYRYDKLQSESSLPRVPEAVLLALAAVGGSAGALVGMYFPTRHKTAKPSFQAVFWAIIAVQVGVVVFLLARP